MAPGAFFNLAPGAVLVAGAKRGAVYHLPSGELYSLDEAGRRILELAAQPLPVAQIQAHPAGGQDGDETLQFLREVEALQLGSFVPAPAASVAFEEPPPPNRLSKIWVELTERCNLKCIHCYADASTGPVGQTALSRAQFQQVIGEAARLGARWIQFTGGEPLLSPKEDLFALMLAARLAGYEIIEIFTNANLLDDEHCRFFAAQGVLVAISLYSSRPETHDGVTRCPGSFERVREAVQRLQRHEVRFRIGLILMSANCHTELETLEWLQGLGQVPVSRDIIRCPPGARHPGLALLTPELLKRRFRAQPDFPHTAQPAFLRARRGHFCQQEKICVGADGTVFPCVMDRSRVLGRLSQSSLEEVVEGAAARCVWRASKDQTPVCRDCEFRYACADCPPLVKTLAEAIQGSPIDGPVKDPLCLYDPYTGVWADSDALLNHLAERGLFPPNPVPATTEVVHA